MAPRIASPKTAADVDALRQHATRPVLSPAERVAEHARNKRDSFVERAASLLNTAETAQRKVRPDEEAVIDSALREAEVWAGRYTDHNMRAESQRTRMRVVREPLTYRSAAEGGEFSFFRDAWQVRMGDTAAGARLERHQREAEVEMRAMRTKREGEQRERGDSIGVEYETRATPSRTIGQGGNFSPPIYLVSMFAEAPRPDRVLADLVTGLTLPTGVQSVNIPRVLTPGTEASTVADAAAVADHDFTDALASSEVVTIAGNADVALQLLEQSGPGTAHLDQVLFTDLTSAYDAQLESQLTNGKGIGKELLGVLNVEGHNEIAYTSGSPTGVGIFKPLGETFGSVSNTRKLRAEVWLMRGGRWAWLATSEDEQKRPLAPPIDVQSPTAPFGPVGTLLGNTGVHLSESLPSTLGAGGNQDVIIATRPSDMFLWESEPYMSVFSEVLSGTMEARIQLRGYAAFIPHRFPQSIAVLGGTGMVVQANE
jgi:HK97 family phage major capsid protein